MVLFNEYVEKSGFYPKFMLNRSRFNLETYVGRLCHNFDIIDPRTLLTSDDKLNYSIKLLEDYKNGKLSTSVSDKDLWKAQKIKQAIIHPDTGEKVLMPFRMSGFVPFNTPIMAGLLMPNPSVAAVLFFQCLNQTHCAFINYANRNATKPTKMINVVQGYTGAVTAAASIAVGLNVVLRKADNVRPFIKNILQRVAPIPALITASILNVILMRKHELNEGIDVLDKNGKVIGSSQAAAKSALNEMAVSRAVLSASCMILPATLIATAEKTTMLRRIPKLKTPVNLMICASTFLITLPAANAIFPQISKIDVKVLEPTIQKKTTDTVVYYNRGL